MGEKWHTKRRPGRRRRSQGPSVTYIRATLEHDAVIAIEELADRDGVSFGLALEKLLNESESFRELLESVKYG